MKYKNIIILSREYKTSIVLEQFTEKQQKLIKKNKMTTLWDSQTWVSWKDKYNNKVDNFNKYFYEYYLTFPEDSYDMCIFNAKRDNIWNKTTRFLFISSKLDKKLSESINSGYKYKNDLRQDLMDINHSEKLNEYIKKYKIIDKLPEMNNEEIDQFCNICDTYPSMANNVKFIFHNVLRWK